MRVSKDSDLKRITCSFPIHFEVEWPLLDCYSKNLCLSDANAFSYYNKIFSFQLLINDIIVISIRGNGVTWIETNQVQLTIKGVLYSILHLILGAWSKS